MNKTKNILKSLSRLFPEKDSNEAAYHIFEPLADRAGGPFTKKDAEVCRTNMILLAKKILQIHKRRSEEE
jgi:hypothetical protein